MSSNPYDPPRDVPHRGMPHGGKPVRDLGGLTLVLGLFLAAASFGLLAVGVTGSMLISRHGGSALEELPDDPLVLLFGLGSIGYLAAGLVGFVLFMVWVYRATVNADALVAGSTEFTPGWAVGWFFVPIANLFKPYQAVAEIYRASNPEADPDFWSTASVPLYLPLWWGTWIASNVVSNVNQPMFRDPAFASSPSVFGILLANALGAAAAVLLIVVTQRIHRLQVMKAKRVYSMDGRAPAPVKNNPLL